MDKKDALRDLPIEFALAVSDTCEEINGCRVYVDQIIRASSSIGANLFEAKYAESDADFVHKLQISLKECSETGFWLILLYKKGKITTDNYKRLNNLRGSIQQKLIASIKTVKAKTDTN